MAKEFVGLKMSIRTKGNYYVAWLPSPDDPNDGVELGRIVARVIADDAEVREAFVELMKKAYASALKAATGLTAEGFKTVKVGEGEAA